MDALILLIVVFIFLILLACFGHGLWILVATFVRLILGKQQYYCGRCGKPIEFEDAFCGRCGWQRGHAANAAAKDIAAAERQLERLRGRLQWQTYHDFKIALAAERAREVQPPVVSTAKPPGTAEERPPVSVTHSTPPPGPVYELPRSVVTAEAVETGSFEPVPSFLSPLRRNDDAADEPYVSSLTPPPRKSFSEVLNTFMEESNIRWGEIVGGLLIIGCSTALVVSLWSEITRIPVVKFLIFTTVTAALFGVGLYTEHRWKLPTTSRGILTIATLLVPLNFLAIAAVSGVAESPSSLIIASEVVAPAVFLCLVYFAGKVVTPHWPHLLVIGVLGSSVGQLLVRHLASPDTGPGMLVTLGAFPLAFYVAASVWMLRQAWSDDELSESEAIALYITLGALSFAAALPFALLLFRTGPIAMTMMYLAPLVSFGGAPLLATGLLLWKRTTGKLAATKTVGTTMALLGTAVVAAGMLLAWPNPASIIPAALFNFAVFTVLAVVIRFPLAHLPAAACFALAYLVLFHVVAGNVSWLNLRVTSLLRETVSVKSGAALVPLFMLLLAASEWFKRRRAMAESDIYLIAASGIAIVSLFLVTDPPIPSLWWVYAVYALGAFFIAERTRKAVIHWLGAGLMFAAVLQVLVEAIGVSFPTQRALLVCGSMFAGAALLLRRYAKRDFGAFVQVSSDATLIITILLVQVMIFQAPKQVTSMQAQHLFWLAGVWFLLLVLRRQQALFVAFQAALALAIVVGIKAALQTYEWYAYQPHAWLHPQALQIQGVALVIFCLLWISVRLGSARAKVIERFNPFLHTRWAFDRILLWSLLASFSLFVIYGAFTGVWGELRADSTYSFDLAGFAHQHVLQLGSWILLALLLIAFLATFWQRRRNDYLLGALVVAGTMLPLAAGWWEPQLATASAWRWLAAFFLLVFSLPLWFSEGLKRGARKFSLPNMPGTKLEIKGNFTLVLMVMTIASILVLTHPSFIFNSPPQGLQSGFFGRLSRDFSYGVPLFVVALVLVGYAIRERKVWYAFVAGLFLNLTISIACLVDLIPSGEPNRVAVVRLVQVNAISFAAFALVWLGLFPKWSTRLSDVESGLARRLLRQQIGLGVIANVLVIGPLGLRLVTRSEFIDTAMIAAGGLIGWTAFLLTLTAAVLLAYRNEQKARPWAALVVLLASSFLVAFSFAGGENHWRPIHALLVSFTVASWILFGARWLPRLLEHEKLAFLKLADNWPRRVVTVSAIAGGLAALIALRRLGDAPTSQWWSILTLLVLTALFASFSWVTFRRRFIYIGALLFSLAVSIWWLAFFEDSYYPATGFPQANLIALCLAAIGWLLLEFRARKVGGNTAGATFAFHNVAAVGALLGLSVLVTVRLILRGSIWPPLGIDWVASGSVLLLMAACVWDQRARFAVAGLYLAGLVGGALFVDELALSLRRSGWAALLILALYALGAALLWKQRAKLLKVTERLGIPTRIDSDKQTLVWLIVFNGFALASVLCLAFWVDLRFAGWSARILAALAVGAQTLTFALLAEGRWSGVFRRASLTMLGLGLVLAGWSFLTPGITATWLNRAVIVMVVMFALTALYGASLEKLHQRLPDWKAAMLACIPWFIASGVAALLFSLATEVFYQFNFGAVRIRSLALVTIGITLIAGIGLSVLFALSSRHDPLNLSERGRMNYVYAAEIMLVLLFMHVRLTLPWLFGGFFERYWPIVVMIIAYFGVAVAESLRRRRLLVLAQPLERTGTFLPLLPVIGFWLVHSEVDYSALLFIVGGLYGLLSILRRRLLFGVCAAVAGNAGLWYMLHRTDDFQFVQHPQLWLIPVALSVLLAAYLNEDSLTEEQMAGVRYLSLVTIYASSTADIFLNGVADSPWLPILLAALSLAGVFSGIVFRIRGFLLLGSVFLLLSIITMIWYASANLGWTWLWYVAGIFTGATIIFMFAVFEKKRSEVLRVVEGFREWER